MPARYTVVTGHKGEPSPTLALTAGDRLRFERRPTRWPGWIWCWSHKGSGWVPERWVTVDGDECVMRRDYRAHELSVDPGQTLEEVLVESGWVLAIGPGGVEGWVPLECLRHA